MSANKLLVCPYDQAHKVKSTRMQLHITRCRLNHLNEIKFTCPFNATHLLPYQERDYHLLHCADKAPLDRILAESLDKNNPFKGRTAVPSYSEALPSKSDEVWEVEEEYDPMPGYLPTKERPSGAVVQPAPFLGASAKRHLYQELHHQSENIDFLHHQSENIDFLHHQSENIDFLHHQSENIDFKSYLNSGSSIPAPIPRQPKQPSEASKFEIEREDFPCLGLGRGKTPGPRIAANIYSLEKTNKNSVPVRSYSSVVGNKMNTTTIQMKDTKMNTNSITGQWDVTDEFLSLGFGRGRIRNAVPRDS